MKTTLVLSVLALLSACSVRTDNNEVIDWNDRVAVRVMCPGMVFSGYYVNSVEFTGLTDAKGRRIGNAQQCAWVKID